MVSLRSTFSLFCSLARKLFSVAFCFFSRSTSIFQPSCGAVWIQLHHVRYNTCHVHIGFIQVSYPVLLFIISAAMFGTKYFLTNIHPSGSYCLNFPTHKAKQALCKEWASQPRMIASRQVSPITIKQFQYKTKIKW